MNVERKTPMQQEQSKCTSCERIKDRIEDISFGNYVDVVMFKYDGICIADDVTEEEKLNARSMLMAEFADMVGDIDYIASVQEQFKTMRLSLKQLMLELGQKVLQLTYNEEVFDFLKRERLIPRNAQYPNTPEELAEVINLMRNEVEFINVELAENTVKSKNSGSTETADKPSKRTFIKLLASVSQFVKFNVTFETNCAVVAEYVARLQEYQREMERNKTKK